MKNKFVRKIITLLMLAGASIGLTGCDDKHQKSILEIKEMFEYDADYDINLENWGHDLKLETTIDEENHILNFQFYQQNRLGNVSGYPLCYNVYFNVDKDTYFDFKRNFSSDSLDQEDVEMVQYLVENYDPYKIDSHISGEEDWTNDEPTL